MKKPRLPSNVPATPSVQRMFPGPRGTHARLRVAMERLAYAELIAHAKSSLQAEVCGVLAGTFCEDDEGKFVAVEAIVRGTQAAEAGAQVTFTQATWHQIHSDLERLHPKLRIVGWYHTHPGFGVEFSEMDLFIQRNFFPDPAHLALVTDPLSGDVAICVNDGNAIAYLDRFWIDGREQRCRLPAPRDQSARPAVGSSSGESSRALEDRVMQLVQAVDEMKQSNYRIVVSCAVLFCSAVLGVAGYLLYSQWANRNEPMHGAQNVPVVVKVGDHTLVLGVNVSWVGVADAESDKPDGKTASPSSGGPSAANPQGDSTK